MDDEKPIVVGVTGYSGSGKSTIINEFKKRFESRKIQRVSIGDAVRNRMKKHANEFTYLSLQHYNDSLMNELGKSYISIVFDSIDESSNLIFVDAVRTPHDYDTLAERYPKRFFLIGIHCDENVRLSRMLSRQREGDIASKAEFDQLAQKEKAWGVEDLLAVADLKIDNNSLDRINHNVQLIFDHLDVRR